MQPDSTLQTHSSVHSHFDVLKNINDRAYSLILTLFPEPAQLRSFIFPFPILLKKKKKKKRAGKHTAETKGPKQGACGAPAPGGLDPPGSPPPSSQELHSRTRRREGTSSCVSPEWVYHKNDALGTYW